MKHTHKSDRRERRIRGPVFYLTLCGAIFVLGQTPPLLADPPPWAPAHGYRNKHKVKPAKTRIPAVPLDIGAGRCNRELVGAAIGGVAGGVIGSKIGKGDGKALATIGGTLIGIFIGHSIGRQLDEADRSCMEHALEEAPNNRPVRWRNPDENTDYSLTPTSDFMGPDGRRCREYTSTVTVGGQSQPLKGTACRDAEGRWVIRDQPQ